MLFVLFFGPFLVAHIYVYMCSGLADVIYDFHAVIGTVPAGRCSGKQPKKQQNIFPAYSTVSSGREEFTRLFLFSFFSSVTKIQTTKIAGQQQQQPS